MDQMKLQELKAKSPTDLVSFAEGVDVENASTMRKQELMFAILKNLAEQDTEIIGEGVVEILQDGSGFLRSAVQIICRDPMISIFLPRKSENFH